MNILIYEFLEVMQTAITGATNSATLLPGGVWYGRAPDDTVAPYGVIEVTDGKKTFTANGFFFQNLSVKITVYYTAGGVAGNDAKNAFAMLSEAFDFKKVALASGNLISMHPSLNFPAIDSMLKNSKDVFVATFVWEVLLSGENTL